LSWPGVPARARGIGLTDVLIAISLTSFLLVSVVQLVLAASGSYRLQKNLGGLQQDARFAFDSLRDEITQAGYRPQPWLTEQHIPALSPDTQESYNGYGDRLGLRFWSDRNCYGSPNPETDGDGRAEFHLRESRYQVNTQGNLAWTCRYGADTDSLITQVNGFGLVESVESFQLLFAEDQDGDGNADHWVNAAQWQEERSVIAVQVGLLLASPRRPMAVCARA
jgi:type II secretory pathway component PulJ